MNRYFGDVSGITQSPPGLDTGLTQGLQNFFGDGSDGDFNPSTLVNGGTTAPNGGTIANLWDGNAGTSFTTNSLSAGAEQVLFTVDLGTLFNSYAYMQRIDLFGAAISTGATRNLNIYRSNDGSSWVQQGAGISITTTPATASLTGINAAFRYWQFRLGAGGSACTFTTTGVSLNGNNAAIPWFVTFDVTPNTGIVIKQFFTLTMPSGYWMTTASPCMGLIVFCRNSASLGSFVEMTQKGTLAQNGGTIPMVVTKKNITWISGVTKVQPTDHSFAESLWRRRRKRWIRRGI